MSYFVNQCAIEGSAKLGLSLLAQLPYGTAIDDPEFYMKCFKSQSHQGHTTILEGSYVNPLGFAGSQSSMYNTHAIQAYLFGGQSSYTASSQYEYQNLQAGVMEPCDPRYVSQGGTLGQGREIKISPKAVSRSNKIRNRIHELHPLYSSLLTSVAPQEGRTRTRDKYRVVYTEKQRVGLEKAYKEDKFITMAKKADLSKTLDLSDRQIKIWFQNRRAKERRDTRNADNVDPANSTSKAKSSCRFEKGNISPISPTTRQAHFEQPVPSMMSPVYRMANLDQYSGFESLLPQSTNFKMDEQEVPSSPEAAHTRFQMSPSEWMDAYYQPMINTVNVSPFTSSLDVNFLSRS